MYVIRQLTHACIKRPGRLQSISSLHCGLQDSLLRSKHHRILSASLTSLASFSTTAPLLAKVPLGPARDGFAKARFTIADVPTIDYWVANARPPLVKDLSPEECLATAQKYAALALREPINWRQNLTTEHNLSLYNLHHLTNVIITGPPSPAWNLATHILYTGVQLSYTPSILSMVRIAFLSNKLGAVQFLPAEEAFARLLARRDDPDACTLKGLIYSKQNTPEAVNKALEWFRLAVRIGGKEPQAWEWQPSCMMGLAKIYLKQNKTEEAEETLRFAATRLDISEACWLYAATLSQDDVNRSSLLTKAAVSGSQEAARELAQDELRKLEGGGLSKRERAETQALADEWLGIAGDKALY